MEETADRQNDVMLMMLGVQVSIVAAVFELFPIVVVGALFTFLVYTNELRRRR